MINITNLVYGAVGSGELSAPVLINFTNDLNATVYLSASFQGDPVKANTIQVDNYTGENSVKYRIGNQVSIIPAYSVGHIDVSKVDNIEFISQVPQSLQIYVLNTVVSEGFTSRGVIPSSLTNDQYYSNVKSLSHFENTNGSLVSLDTANDVVWTSNISTAQKKFGVSSAFSDGTPAKKVLFQPSTPIALSTNNIGTFEFFINFSGIFPNNSDCVFFELNSDGVANSDLSIFATTSPSSNIIALRIARISGGAFVPIGFIPLLISKNTFHYFSFVYFGGILKIFFNGEFKSEFALPLIPSNISKIEFFYSSLLPTYALGYVDEFRWTDNVARYITEASLPTSPFLNQ